MPAFNSWTGVNSPTLDAQYVPAGRVARGAVCFTFDDGYNSWSDIVDALNPGQKVTFFVQSGRIDLGAGITTAEVAAWHAAGHEIGAHSTAHANYTSLTATQRDTDHDACLAAIEAITGAGTVKSFAYPSGGQDATTNKECLHRYDRIFGIDNDPSHIVQHSALPGQFLYGRYSMAPTATRFEHVLDLIRKAATNPITVVIYAHDPGNSSGSFATDPSLAEIAQAFDLCYSLGVPMTTVSQALPSAPATLVNGGFESGLYGWTATNSGGYTAEVVTDTPADGLPGSKSLHLVSTGATTFFVEQIIPVNPSTPINLSYRYKHTSGTGHYHNVVQYDAVGTAGTSTNSGPLALGSGAWTAVNRDVTLDATTVALGIRFGTTAATEAYIDHVHVGPQAWGKHG